MIAKCGQRRGRDGVDGVRSDQLLDVEDIAVSGILGARAGPEHALCLGALRAKRVPPRAGEDVLVALIGQLRIGNRHLAEQSLDPALLFSFGGLQFLLEQCVDRGIDSADEETSHAGHVRQRLAGRGTRFEPGDERVGHRLVRVAGKEQRHVDVDALADERPDGGESGWRRRNLDHHIRARDGVPEQPSLGERAGGVVREIR